MNKSLLLDRSTGSLPCKCDVEDCHASTSLKSVLKLLCCSVVSGSLIGLAWQEAAPALGAIPGLGFFFLLQHLTHSKRLAASMSLLAGFIGFALACPWLYFTIQFLAGTSDLVSVSLVCLVWLFHGSSFALFSLGYSFVGKPLRHPIPRWLLMPVLWVAIESVFPSLFPFWIGYLFADSLPLAQFAELFGTLGLSLVAAMTAVSIPIAFSLPLPEQRRLKICALLVTLVLPFGIAQWGTQRSTELERQWTGITRGLGKLNVMIVQAETETQQSNQRMINASRKGGDLVHLSLWPESALGDYRAELSNFADAERVQNNSSSDAQGFQPFPNPNSPLLAGADTWNDANGTKKHYVSAILLDDKQAKLGTHNKMELMPYGEYIPGESLFPFLRDWFGHSRIISRGDMIVPIGEVEDQSIGVVLCCEDMYPHLARALKNQNANVLISLGNGMAFDSETALRQHFRIARMRAIENRTFFARCMSRGISALISPTGDVLHELPCLQESAMLVQIPEVDLEPTLYSRLGDMPILVLSWLAVVAGLVLTRTRKPS